jgi:transglutaminase-like putative cysteine protease
MKRLYVLAWVLWAVSCVAWAGDVEHKRGDFKFFVGPAPAFVVPHPVASQWDPKAPGADDAVWRYWLYDEQVDRRKGVDAAYVDYAYEARSQANLGDAGKYQIEFNPEYQRLVLHKVELRRDGAWQDRLLPDKISLARRESDFEKDMSDGRVTALIVLDDVRVGDVVRVNYTITGSNPILAGQSWDSLRTAWRSPLHDVHLRVLYDAGTQVRSHPENGAPAPTVRNGADGVEVSLDAHASPAVVDEGNYPVWYDPWPAVQFGPARAWGDVVAWALPLYPAADALPADLEARIAQWAKLPDPQARLRAALRAVQDEVRYFGVEMGSNTHRPTPPADTWRRRYGDCKDKTYLLSTILGKLGIRAVPALISTSRGRALRDIEPTAAAFNHVIVRATLGDKAVWVDPTMTQQGGNPADVDLSDYGVGLPIVAGSNALETIAPPATAVSGVSTVERYLPQSKDGSVRYEVETTYTGAAANRMRHSLAGTRSEDLQRRYADYYRQRYGALDVVGTPVLHDDREGNTVKVTEAYVLKNPFLDQGGANRALDTYALALDDATSLPRTMARKGPLDLGQPAHYHHEIQVTVPDGWRPTFTEEHQKVDTAAYAFTGAITRSGDDEGKGSVTLRYDLKVKEHELPVDGANAHLGELRRMRDLLSSRLRFAAPSERLGDKERNDRLKALLRDVMQGEGTQ